MKLPSQSLVDSFDRAIDSWLDRLRGNGLADFVFYRLSEAANHSMLWHALTWLPVISKQRSWQRAARISLAFGLESALINGVVKQLFRRQRPVFEEERPHYLRQPKTSSFPSGHATSAAFASVVLSSRSVPLPLIVLATLVSISRSYVRIHHASDVVAGAGFGFAFGLLAKRAIERS